MQNQIIKLLVFSMVLSFCFSACQKSSDIEEDELSQIPTLDEDIVLPTEIEYPSELIATIQKDGHEIKFHSTGSPDNPGIFMEESLYGTALRNEEEYHLAKDENGSNPFDVFTAFTDAEVSIPKLIGNSAKDNMLELSGRQVMEAGKSLELLDPSYSKEELKAEYRGCSGDIGYSNFKNWYCKTSHPWNIHVCDPNKNTGTIYRYSKFKGIYQKHQNTRVRMNVLCAGVRVAYYYLDNGKWNISKIATLNPGNRYQAQWVSKKTRLSVIILPFRGAQYRSMVNFVK